MTWGQTVSKSNGHWKHKAILSSEVLLWWPRARLYFVDDHRNETHTHIWFHVSSQRTENRYLRAGLRWRKTVTVNCQVNFTNRKYKCYKTQRGRMLLFSDVERVRLMEVTRPWNLVIIMVSDTLSHGLGGRHVGSGWWGLNLNRDFNPSSGDFWNSTQDLHREKDKARCAMLGERIRFIERYLNEVYVGVLPTCGTIRQWL